MYYYTWNLYLLTTFTLQNANDVYGQKSWMIYKWLATKVDIDGSANVPHSALLL